MAGNLYHRDSEFSFVSGSHKDIEEGEDRGGKMEGNGRGMGAGKTGVKGAVGIIQ